MRVGTTNYSFQFAYINIMFGLTLFSLAITAIFLSAIGAVSGNDQAQDNPISGCASHPGIPDMECHDFYSESAGRNVTIWINTNLTAPPTTPQDQPSYKTAGNPPELTSDKRSENGTDSDHKIGPDVDYWMPGGSQDHCDNDRFDLIAHRISPLWTDCQALKDYFGKHPGRFDVPVRDKPASWSVQLAHADSCAVFVGRDTTSDNLPIQGEVYVGEQDLMTWLDLAIPKLKAAAVLPRGYQTKLKGDASCDQTVVTARKAPRWDLRWSVTQWKDNTWDWTGANPPPGSLTSAEKKGNDSSESVSVFNKTTTDFEPFYWYDSPGTSQDHCQNDRYDWMPESISPSWLDCQALKDFYSGHQGQFWLLVQNKPASWHVQIAALGTCAVSVGQDTFTDNAPNWGIYIGERDVIDWLDMAIFSLKFADGQGRIKGDTECVRSVTLGYWKLRWSVSQPDNVVNWDKRSEVPLPLTTLDMHETLEKRSDDGAAPVIIPNTATDPKPFTWLPLPDHHNDCGNFTLRWEDTQASPHWPNCHAILEWFKTNPGRFWISPAAAHPNWHTTIIFSDTGNDSCAVMVGYEQDPGVAPPRPIPIPAQGINIGDQDVMNWLNSSLFRHAAPTDSPATGPRHIKGQAQCAVDMTLSEYSPIKWAVTRHDEWGKQGPDRRDVGSRKTSENTASGPPGTNSNNSATVVIPSMDPTAGIIPAEWTPDPDDHPHDHCMNDNAFWEATKFSPLLSTCQILQDWFNHHPGSFWINPAATSAGWHTNIAYADSDIGSCSVMIGDDHPVPEFGIYIGDLDVIQWISSGMGRLTEPGHPEGPGHVKGNTECERFKSLWSSGYATIHWALTRRDEWDPTKALPEASDNSTSKLAVRSQVTSDKPATIPAKFSAKNNTHETPVPLNITPYKAARSDDKPPFGFINTPTGPGGNQCSDVKYSWLSAQTSPSLADCQELRNWFDTQVGHWFVRVQDDYHDKPVPWYATIANHSSCALMVGRYRHLDVIPQSGVVYVGIVDAISWLDFVLKLFRLSEEGHQPDNGKVVGDNTCAVGLGKDMNLDFVIGAPGQF